MASPRVQGTRVGTRFWLQKGFLPAEASAFKNITRESIKDSPYINTMIESRTRRKREAVQKRWNTRQYYQWVRNQYVRLGFTKNASDLVLRGDIYRRNKARRLAFDLFNRYKEKYRLRDNSGKLIETPRRKAKVSKKPITGKRNIDQMIRKDREEIKWLRFRLKFERSPYQQNQFRERIKRHQDRIVRLKTQAKTYYD